MRSFIALKATTPEVLNLLNELKVTNADIKVVKPENIHLTIKFLGEVSENKITAIQESIIESLSSFGPFSVTLKGVGVFPNSKRMRVIWAGFDMNREKVVELNNIVEGALEGFGFRRERRFHPHLTLARVRSPKGNAELKSFVKEYEDTPLGGSRIEGVELMKSNLTPKGPVYSILHQVKLEGVK